jgi:hypothetical protein
MESMSIQNIIIQLLLLVVAVWFVYSGYEANKKAPKISWEELTKSTDMDSLFIAGRIVTGAVIILLLALKLFL